MNRKTSLYAAGLGMASAMGLVGCLGNQGASSPEVPRAIATPAPSADAIALCVTRALDSFEAHAITPNDTSDPDLVLRGATALANDVCRQYIDEEIEVEVVIPSCKTDPDTDLPSIDVSASIGYSGARKDYETDAYYIVPMTPDERAGLCPQD